MITSPTNAKTRVDLSRRRRLSWYASLAVLTLFAFGWRWHYDATAQVLEPIRGDAAQYYAYAQNLVHHQTFSKSPVESPRTVPDSFRDPGYPLFLASWMAVFGDGNAWYAAVLLSQAAFGALSVLMIALLASRWLSAAAALASGLLAAVWPHSVVSGSLLLTETLFGFFVLLALLLLSIAAERGKRRGFFIAGLLFGCASAVNSVLMPFAVLLALWLGWRKRLPWQFALPLLFGALLIPGLWTVRNLAIGSGDSARDRALINLVQGAWPEYHAAYRGAAIHGDPASRELLARITREQNAMIESPTGGISAIAGRIASEPLRYLGWYVVRKPALFWGWGIRIGQGDIYVYPTLNSPYERNPFWRAIGSLCRALNPLILFMALAGALLILWRRPGPSGHVPPLSAEVVALAAIYATSVYDVFQAEPRYSIPFRPLEFAIAATAVVFAVSKARQLRREGGMRERQKADAVRAQRPPD